MRRAIQAFGALGIAAVIAALISSVDLSNAQPTILTPTVSAGSLPANQVVQLIAPNPTRRAIRICNTGPTNNLWIFPSTNPSGTTLSTTAAVSDYVLAPLASNVISCYTPPTGMTVNASGQANGGTTGYYGYSGSGTNASVEEW